MNKPLTNVQARDAEALLHPYTPIHRLNEIGPLVLERAKGVYIYDTQGREYIEGMAGLWCTGLGYGDEELIEAATQQLRTLSYSHLFGAKGMEPAIELAEKLNITGTPSFVVGDELVFGAVGKAALQEKITSARDAQASN